MSMNIQSIDFNTCNYAIVMVNNVANYKTFKTVQDICEHV